MQEPAVSIPRMKVDGSLGPSVKIHVDQELLTLFKQSHKNKKLIGVFKGVLLKNADRIFNIPNRRQYIYRCFRQDDSSHIKV